MSDITPERIAEIERGCGGVTKGPWEYDIDDGYGPQRIQATTKSVADIIGDSGETELTGQHIARCDPQTILSLIAWGRANLERAERAEAERDRLREAYKRGHCACKFDENETLINLCGAHLDAIEQAIATGNPRAALASGEKKGIRFARIRLTSIIMKDTDMTTAAPAPPSLRSGRNDR